jgi:hypothetical protein
MAPCSGICGKTWQTPPGPFAPASRRPGHPSPKGLRRGGPGRPLGVPNKHTAEVKDFCASIVDDPLYQQAIRKRALAGRLPPMMEALIWHYRWGKPKDETVVQGTLVVRWQDDEAAE